MRAIRVGSVLLLALVVAGLFACGEQVVINIGSPTDDAPGAAPEESTSSSADPTTTSSATTTSTEVGFVQAEGEILLEPAGTAGPEPFAGETFVTVGPPPSLNIPTSTTQSTALTTTVAGAGVQVAAYPGDTAALYGGSKSKLVADKEGQLRFLEANPDKAAAFCAALNSDPTLRWSGGTQVQPSQLRAYFEELTPVMLTRDTRVTNHGFRDGRPTPRQSVLQAGQMVLVDRYGVPRVRCECGNPLTPPKPVRTTPRYTGPRWPGFDPTIVIVIQQTVVIIDDFVLVDVFTGDTFVRPAGTDGDRDKAVEPTVYELNVEMKWYDAPNEHMQIVNWKAEITVNPDGTISGFGEGIWHSDGTTWHGSQQTGTWSGDANFGVDISGTVETTELGRMLVIRPVCTDLTIENVEVNGPDPASYTAMVHQEAPGWILQAFTTLDLSAVTEGWVSASLAAGNYTGSATLIPLR